MKTTALPGTLIKETWKKVVLQVSPYALPLEHVEGLDSPSPGILLCGPQKTSRLNSLITHLKNYFCTWFKWDIPFIIFLMTLEFQRNKLKINNNKTLLRERIKIVEADD